MIAYDRLKKCIDICNKKTQSVQREHITEDVDWVAPVSGKVKITGHGTGQHFLDTFVGNSIVIPKSFSGLDEKYHGMSNVSKSSSAFQAVKGQTYQFVVSQEGSALVLEKDEGGENGGGVDRGGEKSDGKTLASVGMLNQVPRSQPTFTYDTCTKNIKFEYKDDRQPPATEGQGAIPSDFIAVLEEDLGDGTFRYSTQLLHNPSTPCGGVLDIEYVIDPMMYIDPGDDYSPKLNLIERKTKCL